MCLVTISNKTFTWIAVHQKLSIQCFDTVGWATGRASGL